MLKARIITAICLLAVFFCALFLFPPIGWLGFCALVAVLAFWEWGGLMRFRGPLRWAVSVAAAVVIAVLAACFPAAFGLGGGSSQAWPLGRWLYFPAAAFWLAVVPLWLARRWIAASPLTGILTGAVVILPAWAALVQLRQLGALSLLAVMAIVWLADIAAYFSGRALGRHKLAPAISPGKTWEGAAGGVLAVVAAGLLFAYGAPGGFSGHPGVLVLLLAALVAVSIAGDLFESLLKRQAGLKDSGNMLPGHGGVLDRIDSLTSTLPLVALLRFGLGV
ncbi:MAG: phosphatidate cytidylyltransferase [Candidatus Accumulibacter sp.]|jgi:phosphatidate cytidylyltransferase|nr:phosphatidate cytidylyltransferase [Accumulibacter sp.]